MNAWVITLVLPFTVLMALTLGVVTSYLAVSGILHAFGSSRVKRQSELKPVLLARKAQAGAS